MTYFHNFFIDAGRDGLFEMSGNLQEYHVWHPRGRVLPRLLLPNREEVITVDAINNNEIYAGLKRSQMIIKLNRIVAGSTWNLAPVSSIPLMEPIFRTCAHKDLLAVIVGANPSFVKLIQQGARLRIMKHPQDDVVAVAMNDGKIAVATSNATMDDVSVEVFASSNLLLWKKKLDRFVFDLCFYSRIGAIIVVQQFRKKCVLKASTGSSMLEIFSTVSRPSPFLLAIIDNENNESVNVYVLGDKCTLKISTSKIN